MQSDILPALNEGTTIVLLMLDLSAAFDIIDHQILLSRLHDMYGIIGDVHAWSFLSDRTQCIDISNVLSYTKKLTFDVPQGYVLERTLNCLYTKPVSDIIRRFDMPYHPYADNWTLYDVLGNVEKCVAEVKIWVTSNMVKLNDDKTELSVFPHSSGKLILSRG